MPNGYLTDGTEYRVNTYTTGDQSVSDIAPLKDGGYIVTWQSFGQDGSDFGIYGQRYDASGTAQGIEFRVNSIIGQQQVSASVATLNSGEFIVVWEGESPPGGTTSHLLDIYGQRYSAAGTAIGAEFQINTSSFTFWSSYQNEPSIAALAGGGYVVAWDGYYGGISSNNIHVQIFDENGAMQGDAFVANTVTLNSQDQTAITGLSGGGFVVTWRSYLQDSDGYGVYGKVFDATGTATTADFRINHSIDRTQDFASVTQLDDGGFVVTWNSNHPPYVYDIFGQRYDAAGAKVGGQFIINTNEYGAQNIPDITSLADGGMIVVWQSNTADGSNWGIQAQRFDALGSKVGAEFSVNTTTDNGQSLAAVTGLANGGFVVTWQSQDQDGDGLGIYAQNFAAQTFGTATNDILVDRTGTNWLGGQDGDDDLRGRKGNDIIYGGEGADALRGEKGNDQLFGDNGDDTLIGAKGDDSLFGGAGKDDLQGGGGGDYLSGGEDNDTLNGQGGNDTLAGDAGRDKLIAGTGNDDLQGGAGSDILKAGRGNDQLTGGAGKDKLTGGDGADVFVFIDRTDSTNSKADIIRDFQIGSDQIDLSGLPGNLSFLTSGGFSGTASELRVIDKGTDSWVRIDSDGNGTADMKIVVLGVSGLTDTDFIL